MSPAQFSKFSTLRGSILFLVFYTPGVVSFKILEVRSYIVLLKITYDKLDTITFLNCDEPFKLIWF